MVKVKLPEISEVTFASAIEPDDTDPRGNVMASGDDAVDREAEDDVIRQVNAGNVAAWCGLVVRAEWRGFQGVASIWGCSYASEEECLASDYASDLRSDAFDALCCAVSRSIANVADRLSCEEA